MIFGDNRAAWFVRAHWPEISLALLITLGAGVLISPGQLPYTPRADFSDASLSHWPNAWFLRQSIYQFGQFPLWNPDRMLGQPFAANPLTLAWYPPQWLVLIVPISIHLNVLLYLHILLLTVGALRLGYRLGLGRLPSLLLGVALALMPKMIAHLGAGHLDILYALAWVPWATTAWLNLIEKRSTREMLLTAAASAMVIMADVRIAFYLLPFAVLYAVAWQMDRKQDLSIIQLGKWAGGALLLIIGLTFVRVLPLLLDGGTLTRADITSADAMVFSLPSVYLVGLLIPDAGGFHEWMTYLGPGLLATLFFTPVVFRRARWQVGLLVGVMILGVIWSLGEHGGLFPLLLRIIPAVSWFRVPSRMWFVVAWAAALLAALFLKRLVDDPLPVRARFGTFALMTGGALIGIGALFLDADTGMLSIGGMTLAIAAGGLWWASAKRQNELREYGLWLLVAVQVVVSAWLATTLVEGRPVMDGQIEDLALIEAIKEDCGRVYSPSFDLIGPAAASARIPTLHAVDPYQLAASVARIEAAAGVTRSAYSVVAPALPPLEEDAPPLELTLAGAHPDVGQLAALGVHWVTAAFPIDSLTGIQVESRTVYRVDDPTLAPACGAAPNRPFDDQVIAVNGADQLVLAMAYNPGWRAVVDGAPVGVRDHDGLIALPVSGEQITLTMVYRPVPVFVGLALSILTMLLMLGWWGVLRRGLDA